MRIQTRVQELAIFVFISQRKNERNYSYVCLSCNFITQLFIAGFENLIKIMLRILVEKLSPFTEPCTHFYCMTKRYVGY